MEPIMEAALEILKERGEFRHGDEIRTLFDSHEEWNDGLSLYEEFIGPAIDKVEDVLMERRTELESEARA
jgi:hypothetical protein